MCLALLMVYVTAGVAQDEDKPLNITFNGTDTLLWRSFDEEFLDTNPDAGDNEWEFYNRLILNLGLDNFSFGVQADIDRFDVDEGDTRIEKRFLSYSDPHLKITLGDFYASFGRGTALSVIKTHEAYGLENLSDDTINGGYARIRRAGFDVQALTGRIHDKYEDTEDEISGVHGTYEPFTWLSVGGSAVRTSLEIEDGDTTTSGTIVELELFDGALVLAHEYTFFNSDFFYRNNADEGRAEYIEAAAVIDDFSVTVEYKDLQNFFAEYSTPPLIEEQDQELLADFFTIYPEDLEALKVRGELILPTSTIIFGTVAVYDEKAARHPSYYRYMREINHIFGGIEHQFLNGLYFSARLGQREEEGTGYYFQFTGETNHGAVDVSVPLFSGFSTSLDYAFSRFEGEHLEFQRDKLSFSLAKSQLFTATWVWERSNLPGEVFFTGKEEYRYFQLEVKLLKRHIARLFVGDNRGGIKCSGGVCKYIPAFSGVRMEGVIRF
jgi:hypothetical protein